MTDWLTEVSSVKGNDLASRHNPELMQAGFTILVELWWSCVFFDDVEWLFIFVGSNAFLFEFVGIKSWNFETLEWRFLKKLKKREVADNLSRCPPAPNLPQVLRCLKSFLIDVAGVAGPPWIVVWHVSNEMRPKPLFSTDPSFRSLTLSDILTWNDCSLVQKSRECFGYGLYALRLWNEVKGCECTESESVTCMCRSRWFNVFVATASTLLSCIMKEQWGQNMSIEMDSHESILYIDVPKPKYVIARSANNCHRAKQSSRCRIASDCGVTL